MEEVGNREAALRYRERAAWIRTCAIITVPPNELIAPIHDRMPVILPSEVWPMWLGEENAEKGELLALLTATTSALRARNRQPLARAGATTCVPTGAPALRPTEQTSVASLL